MKRFDPNYEAALELLPEGGGGLRYISVEVSDPDSWPFVAHRPLLRADDVPGGWSTRAPGSGRRWPRRWEWRWTVCTCAATPTRLCPAPSTRSTPSTACSTGWASRAATWSAATSGRAANPPRVRCRCWTAPRPGTRAGAGAGHHLVPRALRPALRGDGDRDAFPGPLPEPPADRPVGAALPGAAAGHHHVRAGYGEAFVRELEGSAPPSPAESRCGRRSNRRCGRAAAVGGRPPGDRGGRVSDHLRSAQRARALDQLSSPGA